VGSGSRPIGARRARSDRPLALSAGQRHAARRRSGAAKSAALARSPAGRMGAGRPPRRANGPDGRGRGGGDRVPARRPGRRSGCCEGRLLCGPCAGRGRAPRRAAPSARTPRRPSAAASSRQRVERSAGSAPASWGAQSVQPARSPRASIAGCRALLFWPTPGGGATASSPSWRTACEPDEAALVVCFARRSLYGNDGLRRAARSLVPGDKRRVLQMTAMC
jgi:hypothetical protein